jgi:cell division septation protein DedD
MTTQEATHAPTGTGEETDSFEVAPPSAPLEVAPPLLLESVTTPLLEGVPLPLSFEDATPTPSLSTESAPTPSLLYPAATPEPPRRVNTAAPDPFAVGVRLLRMAPVWLLLTTFGCVALVLTLGWLKAGGDATAVALTPKQNDSRSVQISPKANAPAPKTAAANSPEVATPPAPVAANPNPAPAAPPAQVAAPAPVEQPAPKAPEKTQAEQPAQAGDAGAKFTVQVGSHTDQSEANEQVSRLRAAGFEARSVAAELPGRGTWYRVQVGRFADRAEASKTIGQLRAKGAAAGAIVTPLQN